MKRQMTAKRVFEACAGFAATVFTIQAACVPGREFRAVATPALQAGASQIINGLLDGFFAAIAPEPEGAPDSSRDL